MTTNSQDSLSESKLETYNFKVSYWNDKAQVLYCNLDPEKCYGKCLEIDDQVILDLSEGRMTGVEVLGVCDVDRVMERPRIKFLTAEEQKRLRAILIASNAFLS